MFRVGMLRAAIRIRGWRFGSVRLPCRPREFNIDAAARLEIVRVEEF